jgi:alkylation response protein AidB-like acyl-CoA dehydrogenase
MRFAFTADQLAFGAGVRAVLQDWCPPSAVRSVWDGERAAADHLWKRLADVGLLGALVPGADGGLGLNELDILPCLVESGRAAVPLPLVESAVVAARLLTGTAQAERLPALAAGEQRITVSLDVTGLLPWAGFCDWALVGDATAVHVIPMPECAPAPVPTIDVPTIDVPTIDVPTMELTPVIDLPVMDVPVIDKARPLAQLPPSPAAMPPAPAPAGREVPPQSFAPALVTDDPRRIGRARRAGTLATAAQLIGLGERMLWMTVGYVKERRQFGAPIGSFQAVKHALADALVALELTQPLVHAAGWAHVHDRPSADRDVAAAKIRAGEAAGLVARTALQCHGGMGYTQEYDLHLWLKRTWALQASWGQPGDLRAVVAQSLGLTDAGGAHDQ